MRKILVLNEHRFCYVYRVLIFVEVDSRFQMNIILFLLNAHHLYYNLYMVDFTAHFTIYTIALLLPVKCSPWKVIHLACQSERSPCYFHLDRISDSFAIHCSSSCLQQRKDLGKWVLKSNADLNTNTKQTSLLLFFKGGVCCLSFEIKCHIFSVRYLLGPSMAAHRRLHHSTWRQRNQPALPLAMLSWSTSTSSIPRELIWEYVEVCATDSVCYLCRAEVTVPIHFRYQPPSPDSAYVAVQVPAPILMVPHPLGPASLPCHADTRDTCLWAVVTPLGRPHNWLHWYHGAWKGSHQHWQLLPLAWSLCWPCLSCSMPSSAPHHHGDRHE